MCYSLTLCLPLISVAYYKTYIYVGNSSCEAVCFVHPKLLSASQTSLIPQTPQVSPDHPQFYACWAFLRFHNLSFFYCYLIGIVHQMCRDSPGAQGWGKVILCIPTRMVHWTSQKKSCFHKNYNPVII